MKRIKEILFGRIPDIFDKEEGVRHDLKATRWSQWKARYTKSGSYNWRRHSGKTKQNPPYSK